MWWVLLQVNKGMSVPKRLPESFRPQNKITPMTLSGSLDLVQSSLQDEVGLGMWMGHQLTPKQLDQLQGRVLGTESHVTVVHTSWSSS